MLDWDKVSTLLEVVHKAVTAGPAYTWFGDQAYAELLKMKEEELKQWQKTSLENTDPTEALEPEPQAGVLRRPSP